MDQHPVPQNISSYEFRLVGDMTLKQFFQLAGGIAMGVLFYKLPLPFFLKWPLAGISVLTGVMLAFVPVSGRPFSQWLMAFVRAIYSPTQYSWSASPAEPMEAAAPTPSPAASSPLDKIESQVVGRISQLFTAQPPPSMPVAPVAPINIDATPAAPVQQATETTIHEMEPQPAAVVPGAMEPKRPIMVAEIVDSAPPAQEKSVVSSAAATPQQPTINYTPFVAQPQAVATPATYTDQLTPPERPNLITGVVLGVDNRPVEGVILEISDSKNGIPVRALRTNKLGQFQTATPLANGTYNLTAEKVGLTFTTVSLVCDNAIVKPILVTAHA